MTGMLQDLLRERADEVGTPLLDLDAIARDGDRRVRHRRTALLGGTAAAAVAVVTGIAVLAPGAGPSPDSGRDRVAGGTAPVSLSWVTGSTLHRAGQPDLDLGVDVRAWVWVGDDIVLTSADGKVRLWRAGATEVVGEIADRSRSSEDPELVTDGTAVSWVDLQRGLVRLDVTTGQQDALPVDLPYGSRVTAMDGDLVYAVDQRGVFTWDSVDGEVEVLDPQGRDEVIDAEGGTVLYTGTGRRARVSGPSGTLRVAVDSYGDLSPSGARLAAESDDEGLLLDTTNGERLTVDTGHDWALPFQWLTDDTVTVLAFDGPETEDAQDDAAYLLSCTVSTGACDDGVEIPLTFQLPIGIHLDT